MAPLLLRPALIALACCGALLAAAASSAAASAAASTADLTPAAAVTPAVTPTVTPAAHHPERSREQAAAALMALPELQAWSALLAQASGGASHGALVAYDPAPRTVNGKRYWQFSYVEDGAQAVLRWESFLACTSDDEILVDDSERDELLSLERWRRERLPAQRRSSAG